MKTKQLFLAMLLFLPGLFCTSILAQNTEVSVDGQTYSIDKLTKDITNKSNKIAGSLEADKICYDFAVRPAPTLYSLFKQVFTKEKIIALAQENASVVLSMYCAPSGQVLEMSFSINEKYFFVSSPSNLKQINLQEVKKVEDLMKKFAFSLDIYGECPGVKYYNIHSRIRFDKLLD